MTENITTVSELITEEADKLSKEKSSTSETVRQNRARIEELVSRLRELRGQIKPDNARRDRDDFGRTPRETVKMEIDLEGDRGAERLEAEEERDREEGIQIRGDDGDVEVEY